MAFIPAERGMFNELAKEHCGFIYFREVPVGKYIMKGALSRGSGNGENLLEKVINNNKGPDISFEFEITPGAINYLGEFITVHGKPVTSSTRINDKRQRDLSYLLKKYPGLKKNKVIYADCVYR